VTLVIVEPGSKFYPSLEAVTTSILSALAYSYNWLIAHAAPQIRAMVHIWSLSIEEQFYLLWPLALLGLLGHQLPRRRIRQILSGAIVASLSIPFWYWDWDWRRLYYASDFRAHAMLAGALLALTLADSDLRARIAGSRLFGPLAVASSIMLAAFAITVHIDTQEMYVGGFGLAVLASAVLIAWVVESSPDEPVIRFLETRPMVWLGQRSHGIDLYHMPVCVGSGPLDLPWAQQLIWVCGTTGLIVELSYRYLERPIIERRGFSLKISPLPAFPRSAAA